MFKTSRENPINIIGEDYYNKFDDHTVLPFNDGDGNHYINFINNECDFTVIFNKVTIECIE